MSSVKRLVPVVGVLLLTFTSTARAQRAFGLVEGYGAYVLPAGSYTDIVDAGWAAGGLVGLAATPHLWLMGSFTSIWLSGQTDTTAMLDLPGWTNSAYFGMLGYDPVPPNMNGDMIMYVGAGGVTFDPDAPDLESEAYFAVNAGVKFVFHFSRNAAGTLNLAGIVAFADESFVGGTTWFFPLGAGLAIRF